MRRGTEVDEADCDDYAEIAVGNRTISASKARFADGSRMDGLLRRVQTALRLLGIPESPALAAWEKLNSKGKRLSAQISKSSEGRAYGWAENPLVLIQKLAAHVPPGGID